MIASLPRLAWIVPALTIGWLMGCSPGPTDNQEPSIVGQVIHPKAGPGITLSRSPTNQLASTAPDPSTPINLPADYQIQGSSRFDFDQDGKTEQLLAVKKASDPTNVIWVVLATASPNGPANIAWEGRTSIASYKTYLVSQQDVLGIHKGSLVIRGATKEFKQYLMVLHPTQQDGRLQARIILNLEADTAIDIEATPRSAAYAESQDNALAYAVNAMNKDTRAPQSLDLIKTVWNYNPSSGLYQQVRTDFIPGSKIQESQLDVVYHGAKEDFEAFLQGAWIRTAGADKDKTPPTTKQIMFIDRDSRVVQLIEGDRLESNEWIASFKGSYSNYLQAYIVNESFRSLRSSVGFGVVDNQTISVTIQDRPEWSGTYQRVSSGQDAGLSLKLRKAPQLHKIMLSGLYKDEKEEEILFTGQTFFFRSKGKEQGGEYISFELNESVLTFAYLNEQAIVQRTEHYIARFSEQRDRGNLVRTLELQPAELTINGVRPRGSEFRRFVQISR